MRKKVHFYTLLFSFFRNDLHDQRNTMLDSNSYSIFFAGRYSKSVSRESTPQPSVVELDSDNECFDQSPIIQVSERYACRKTVLPFSLDVEIELF